MIPVPAALASLHVALVLWVAQRVAAGDPSTVDPVSSLTTYLAQYGPLGLIVLGFVTGWIVPGPTAKGLTEENKRLQKLFEDEVLPMAKTYAETLGHATEALREATEALRDERRR